MASKKFRIQAKFTGDVTDILSKTKRLGQNLKTTGDLLSQFGRQATVAMAAVNAAFIGSAIKGASLADQIGKTSSRLGLAAEDLRELSFAAQQTGADLGTIQSAFRRLSTNVIDAAKGLQEAEDNFGAMKVNIRNAKGELKPLNQLFKESAVFLGNMTDNTARSGLALKLFGRSGDQLILLFEAYAKSIEAFGIQLDLLNANIGETEKILGARVIDALNLWKKSLEGVTLAMLRALGPALEKFLVLAAAAISTLSRWIDRNRGLVVGLAKLFAVLGVLIGGFTVWAGIVGVVGSAISGLVTFLAGPVAFAFLTSGVVVGLLAAGFLWAAQASDIAVIALGGLEIAIGGVGIIASAATGNVRFLTASIVALASGVATIKLAPKVGEKIEETKATYAGLFAQLKILEEAFKKTGVNVDSFTNTISDSLKAMQGLRAEILKPSIELFAEGVRGGLLRGIDPSLAGFFQKMFGEILDEVKNGAINDIASAEDLIAERMRRLFLNLALTDPSGGVVANLAETELQTIGRGIKEAFGGGETAESVLRIQEFADSAEGIAPMLADAARQSINLNSEIQKLANVALVDLGNVGTRASGVLLNSLLKIGDAVGSLIENFTFATDKFGQLEETLRIAEINEELALTEQGQARWSLEIERTRREMLKMELAAIKNQTAWDRAFSSISKWVKQLLAEVAALIVKFLILKAISAAFGLGDGGVVGGLVDSPLPGTPDPLRGASGGLVTGGIPGKDSVPAFLMPGELVIPADDVGEALSRLSSPSPVVVQINAGLLAGDEGTAREIVRMVQEKMRFNDTGKTI